MYGVLVGWERRAYSGNLQICSKIHDENCCKFFLGILPINYSLINNSQPSEEASIIADFVRLWFAVRRTATTEHIEGDDTLDMEPEAVDKSYPLFGKVPLPPVMIQQLDMVLTLGFLQPLRKKVLDNFQKIVLANKPKSWMTIYLITFISLHSAATVTHENYHNARKHGLKVI